MGSIPTASTIFLSYRAPVVSRPSAWRRDRLLAVGFNVPMRDAEVCLSTDTRVVSFEYELPS